VNDDGKMRVRNHGVIVAEIPSRELADEAPLLQPAVHHASPHRSAGSARVSV